MENAVILVTVALIIGAIVGYLIRSHRRGKRCIGCPYAKECTACSTDGCAEAPKNEEKE
ncbi:MAG: FeoB-associated Cys-rich membrane protein [Clostridia bacterium]|nr:FeoB-associated Cys-rich membrane protein [Clostridia bacterium]